MPPARRLWQSDPMNAEFLIVGQGLAGTALAWRLLERGRSFVIVDRDEPLTSSKVAAGLVTPVTGIRLTLNWKYDVLHPEAVRFYRGKERLLGQKFYFPRPLVWLYKNEREHDVWQRRRLDESIQRYMNPASCGPLVDENRVENLLGGFQLRHAGFLDTAPFLEASRRYFESLGCWRRGEVNEADLDLNPNGVSWCGEPFGTVVFCQGWEAAKSRWFSWLPFGPARGTILTLLGDTGERRSIINRGCWLVPRGDGVIRAGSSFDLQFDQPNETSAGSLDALLARLRSLLKTDFEVINTQTAVRPIVNRRKATIGSHPAQPKLALLNGLGSKGVLRAPYMARRLVEHLLDGVPLDPEIDLQANL